MEPATVIIGGGIIGLSTAYYLGLDTHSEDHRAKDSRIFVVEASSKICAGASGQNEGVLGEFGFKDEVMPLAKLSYGLHTQIANENQGKERFGFNRLRIHAVFSEGYDPLDPKLPFPTIEQESLSELPKWIKVPSVWEAGIIVNGTNSSIMSAVTCASGHEYNGVSHIDIRQEDSSEPIRVLCRNLVLSAGSWSARVLSGLFPHAKYKIPMAEKQPAQSWLRIRRPETDSTDSEKACNQVWLGPALTNGEIHFSDSLDKQIYAAGVIEDCEAPNQLPESIQMSPAERKAMENLSTQYLASENEKRLNFLSGGRAYLPRTLNDIPIIARVPQEDLFPSDKIEHGPNVFLNLGHYLDGLTPAPGSGKLMSELIRGVNTSVDPTPFQLRSQSI